MKNVVIQESRLYVTEDELRRLGLAPLANTVEEAQTGARGAFGLAEARLVEHSGRRELVLVWRKTTGVGQLSVDALPEAVGEAHEDRL